MSMSPVPIRPAAGMPGKPITETTVAGPIPPMQQNAGGVEEQQRKARADRAVAVNAVLNGEFRDMVQSSLSSRYHQETFGDLQSGACIKSNNNVMTDVLDRVATAWPSAVYTLRKGTTDIEDDAFDRLLEMLQLESLAAELDRKGLVHPGIILFPILAPDPETQTRRLRVLLLTPDEFDLRRSPYDRNNFCAFTYFYTDAGGVACKTVWTALRWDTFQKDARAGVEEWALVDTGEHRHGRIPAVYYRFKPHRLWSENYGKDLCDTTVEVNAAESHLALVMPGQVKTMLGQAPHLPPGQVGRHMAVLEAGDNSSVQVADWQLDTATFVETFIKRPRRTAAVRLGLPGDEWDVGVPPSGEALRMRYAERDLRATQRQYGLKKAVYDLVMLCMELLHLNAEAPVRVGGKDVVWPIEGFSETAGLSRTGDAQDPEDAGEYSFDGEDADDADDKAEHRGGLLPPFEVGVPWKQQPVQLHIDIGEPRYPESAAEREARSKFELDTGLTDRGELLKERNPDVEKPLEMVRKKLELERGFRQTLQRAAVPAAFKAAAPGQVPPPGQQPPEAAPPPPPPKGKGKEDDKEE